MGRKLVSFILLFILFLSKSVWAAPDTTMSITPSAVSGETITASDENSRNNEVSTKYNSHSHTDLSSSTSNTFTIGDNAVGSKTYAINDDQSNNPGLRYNTTTDLWTLSNDGSTYLAVAHAGDSNGVTSGAMIYGGSSSGAILSAGRANTGQVFAGVTDGSPRPVSLLGAGATTVTATESTITFGTTFATPALTLSTANSAGVASTVIRSDATVAAFDSTVPGTATFGASAATGSAAVAARRDHAHGMPQTAWQYVESIDFSAGGTSLSSTTLPTDSDLFMLVFENVKGTVNTQLFFSGIDNHISIRTATLTATADAAIAEFGTSTANAVNGVLYVPRLATNSKIICPGSVSYETTGGAQAVLLRAEDTGASTFTAFTFTSTDAFVIGKVHIYKEIPS